MGADISRGNAHYSYTVILPEVWVIMSYIYEARRGNRSDRPMDIKDPWRMPFSEVQTE